MTTPISKHELDVLVSKNLAYTSPAVEGMEGAVDARRTPGFGATLARWFGTLTAIPRRRAVLEELNMLTDRELADVGLTRGELGRVFDPVFAASRSLPHSR